MFKVNKPRLKINQSCVAQFQFVPSAVNQSQFKGFKPGLWGLINRENQEIISFLVITDSHAVKI